MSDLLSLVPLLLKLGLAVYEAIRDGDTTRTVGEIFDGVPRDMQEILRLRAEAERELSK